MPHILPYFLLIEINKFLIICPILAWFNFLLSLLKKWKEKQYKVNFCILSWKTYQLTCICTYGDCFPLPQWVIFIFPTFLLMPSYLLPVPLGFHSDVIFLLSIFLSTQSVPCTGGHTYYPWAADKQLKAHDNKTSSFCTPLQQSSLEAIAMGAIFLCSLQLVFLLDEIGNYSYQDI